MRCAPGAPLTLSVQNVRTIWHCEIVRPNIIILGNHGGLGPRRSSSDGARGPSTDQNGAPRSTHSSLCSPTRTRGRPRIRPSSGHVAGRTFALMSVGRIRLRIRPDQSVQMRPALSLHIRHHLCCEQCRFQSECGLLPGTDECCLHLNVGQPNSTHVQSEKVEKVAPHFFQLSPHATPCSIFLISIHINYFQCRYDPQICGSKKCPYLNLCLAKAAGFTDAQCNPPPPCTLDVKICPTGEVYQRSPLLDCRFPPCRGQTCPLGESITRNLLFCGIIFTIVFYISPRFSQR